MNQHIAEQNRDSVCGHSVVWTVKLKLAAGVVEQETGKAICDDSAFSQK